MKSLSNYINESIEFDLIDSYYGKIGVVTLVKREGIDCANLSKEDFVSFMNEDIKIAHEEYSKICKKYNDDFISKQVEKAKKNAIEYAEKKYKRQSYKDKYIQNAIKNAENSKAFFSDADKIFFDFKPDTGENGINSVCIISPKDVTDSQLEKCYDIVSKSKYFKKATGWSFKYESQNKDKVSVYSFRPYIDLILDENTRSEQQRDADRLRDSINNFYKDSNYWGD